MGVEVVSESVSGVYIFSILIFILFCYRGLESNLGGWVWSVCFSVDTTKR